MPFSEFAIIRPNSSEAYCRCSVTKTQDGLYRITISSKLLGKNELSIMLWLVICQSRVHDEEQLCFRPQIWTAFQTKSSGGVFNDDLLVESILDVRDLDSEFKPETSSDGTTFSFSLSEKLVNRSYLCHEYPMPVLDGGVYSTIDLPAFASQE